MKNIRRVLLYLPQGFELYEASVFTDVLGWSGVVGDTKFEIITVSPHKTVKAVWAMQVVVDKMITDVEASEYDALAIPGGFGTAGFYTDAFNVDLQDLVKDFNSQNKYIATVCVGSLSPAKAGVLKNRRATTYHLLGGGKRKQLSELGVEVIDDHLVIDDNIISCTSPAYALDVAFALLERLSSLRNCLLVKEAMGFL